MALSNLGLIQMGGAMLRPGGSLGDGFLAYGDGLVRDDHMKSTALYRNAQMQSLQSQALERQAKIDADLRKRQGLQALLNSLPESQQVAPATQAPLPAAPEQLPIGASGGNALAPQGQGSPATDPLVRMAQNGGIPQVPPQAPQGGFSQRKALEMLMLDLTPEQIRTIAESKNLGRDEVARIVEGQDDLGRPIQFRESKFGDRIGSGVAKPYEKQFKDMGGSIQAVDPYTSGFVGTQMDKTNSPDSLLSARTTMRGQNMTDSRARELAQIQRETNATNKELARSKFDTETEMKLADDYRAESKDFKQIFPAVGKIKAALPMASKSAPAALAAATSFMKLLDPGSVVRESELGMALAATGVIDRLTNYVSRLQNGQVLTPDQTEEFGRVVDKVYQSAVESQELIDRSYGVKAQAYGLRPDMIIGGPNAQSKHPQPKVKTDATSSLPSTADIDAAIARKLQFQDGRGR